MEEVNKSIQNITDEGYPVLIGNGPDNWAEDVWRWFWDNKPEAMENSDGMGAYPDRKEIIDALIGLGYKNRIDPDYLEETE